MDYCGFLSNGTFDWLVAVVMCIHAVSFYQFTVSALPSHFSLIAGGGGGGGGGIT